MRHAASSQPIPPGTQLRMAILATSDLHQHVIGYNYYSLTEDPSVGLDRTATLIHQARQAFPNHVLLDNGDTIQGTLLGDLQAMARPVPCGQTLAIHRVMNALSYDAGTVGNHEFNVGLPFLSQVLGRRFPLPGMPKDAARCGGPAFPVVSTNVKLAGKGRTLLPSHAMLDKVFDATTPDGSPLSVRLKLGIMGFAPPQILDWDRKHLAGRVEVEDAVESARRWVPILRRQGAHVVIALAHGGLDASPYRPGMENPGFHLAGVPGIDAMVTGHAHLVFPAAREPGAPQPDPSLLALPPDQVSLAQGRVRGVPTVMPQSAGRRLGVIALTLTWDGQRWQVQPGDTLVETWGLRHPAGTQPVAPDAAVRSLVAREHQEAIGHARQPLGPQALFPLQSAFAMLGDVSAIQVVNMAQIEAVTHWQQHDAQAAAYRTLPVLSCSAPLKAGRNGPQDYTAVGLGASAGQGQALQIRHVGDLYPFANNNLQAVAVDGKGLRAWLETSAKLFAQIDPDRESPQDLVPSFSTIFNFDVCQDLDHRLRYEIDVRQPAGQRITRLDWDGHPLEAAQRFLVATNDYRASGGGQFPGLDGRTTVWRSSEPNQAILAAYLQTQPRLSLARHAAQRPWRLVPFRTAGPLLLRSQPGQWDAAQAAGWSEVVAEESAPDTAGYGRYRIVWPGRPGP